MNITPIKCIDIPAAIEKIKNLDLEPIQFKLMDHEEGEGWSLDKVQAIAIKYKKFLILKALYTEITISPTRDIDKFWHYHILDTSKYMIDCQNIFGVFLHHFPYLGMRGEKDKKDLEQCFENTKALYFENFGENMADQFDLVATSNCSTYCGDNIELLANLERPKLFAN
ncbi:MAG: glycine-rich domain-containing protein [Patescibacteria group bacterium]